MIGLTGAWLVLLASLPLVAFGCVLALRGYFSTRAVPDLAFRAGTIVAFCALVDPSVGILAALSVGWWLSLGKIGWTRVGGVYLWPVVAMAIWMISAVGDSPPHLLLAVALAVGVVQTLIGISQRFGVLLDFGSDVLGTLGHRTGFGIYLAVLIPVAFLASPPWAWSLAGLYMVGVLLSRSGMAALAALTGILWAAPQAWPVALALGLAGILGRFLERAQAGWQFGWPHFRPSVAHGAFGARVRVWRTALREVRPWPYWLVGRGPEAFRQDAGTWTIFEGFNEVYREAHNDAVEFAYEYGVVGLAAVALWVWRFGPGLAFADPVTGGLAALGTASMGNFPLKVAPIAVLGLVLGVMVMRRVA